MLYFVFQRALSLVAASQDRSLESTDKFTYVSDGSSGSGDEQYKKLYALSRHSPYVKRLDRTSPCFGRIIYPSTSHVHNFDGSSNDADYSPGLEDPFDHSSSEDDQPSPKKARTWPLKGPHEHKQGPPRQVPQPELKGNHSQNTEDSDSDSCTSDIDEDFITRSSDHQGLYIKMVSHNETSKTGQKKKTWSGP